MLKVNACSLIPNWDPAASVNEISSRAAVNVQQLALVRFDFTLPYASQTRWGNSGPDVCGVRTSIALNASDPNKSKGGNGQQSCNEQPHQRMTKGVSILGRKTQNRCFILLKQAYGRSDQHLRRSGQHPLAEGTRQHASIGGDGTVIRSPRWVM